MRYWGFLAAKLAAAAAVLAGLWRVLHWVLPPPRPFVFVDRPRFPQDLLWTTVTGIFFLLCCGVIYLSILDQRYRCRVCLRRLRMPIETGSWSRPLQFGRPRIEYICPFGHGTLKVPELQISGPEPPDWKQHDDIWKELESLEESRK